MQITPFGNCCMHCIGRISNMPNIEHQEHQNNEFETEEQLRDMPTTPPARNMRKRLSKQLSCKTSRDVAWENFRRRQILKQEKIKNGVNSTEEMNLTDEDLHELKGSIELGFGFNEEEAQKLCNTLPALDFYFAVNRQLCLSPSSVSTPESGRSSFSSGGRCSSASESDSWKICSPGEDPNQVKRKLRHWAQAVACSVMQHNLKEHQDD